MQSTFENAVGGANVQQIEKQEKNLMKYLSPVKHLYRVAYADPTEHIKRVQNLNMPFDISKQSSKHQPSVKAGEN
jgi:hypothetical protein